MATNNKISLLALIPEIYYDLIARVIPGAVFIFAFIMIKYKCVFLIITQYLEDITIGAASCILGSFLVTSYFLGMFFYTLSHYPLRSGWIKIQNYSWKHVKKDLVLMELIAESLKLDDKKKELLQEKPHEFERYIQDYIKAKDMNAGAIIAKMRAEAFLFSSLFVAFIILFLIILLHPINEWGVQKTIPAAVLLILVVLIYFAYLHRLKSYVHRSYVYIHLISKIKLNKANI